MSRPEKQIDWNKVDQLLIAGCPGTEIAPHFDMHYETFYRRVQEKYNMGFTEYCQLKRQQGDSILRAHQFAKAIGKTTEGDNTLLIWLGKTRLKQKDESYTKNNSQITVNVGKDLGSGLDISTASVPDESDNSTE